MLNPLEKCNKGFNPNMKEVVKNEVNKLLDN